MKRITVLTLLAFCGAAIAANVPRELVHGQSVDERRAEVFSSFIALSDTRGADALPFLSDIASLTGETRRMQQARLDHVSSVTIGLLAEKLGLTPEDYRTALEEGRVQDPFDHSGSVIRRPQFAHHGQDGPWFWGVWLNQSEQADGEVVTNEETSPIKSCRIWLVVWNDDRWFYMPMGTDTLNEIALASDPDLLSVPFAELPSCKPDV